MHEGAGGSDKLPVLEIGILIAGEPDTVDVEAIRMARDDFEEQLRADFPVFDWRVRLVQQPEIPSPQIVEPVELLDHGTEQRERQHWDFVLLITSSDLRARYRPFAFSAIARSLDLAIISTSRLDPRMTDLSADEPERRAAMRRRLFFLMQRAL